MRDNPRSATMIYPAQKIAELVEENAKLRAHNARMRGALEIIAGASPFDFRDGEVECLIKWAKEGLGEDATRS